MRKFLIALAALAVGALASAQASDPQGDLGQAAIGFSFRIGVFWPADNKLRDIAKTFWDTGMEYEFEKSLLKNGKTYLAGDWISDEFVGSRHVANVTINQRIYTRDMRFAAGGSPYFFLGGGVEWLHVDRMNATTWCARGGVGAEFKGNYFIEVAASVSPKRNGVNPSGVSASLGYRFQY